MKMTPEGVERLIKHEGVRYQVYDDKNGKTLFAYEDAIRYPTIGIGHLVYKAGTRDERERFAKYLGGRETMTHAQVVSLLREDLPKYENPVNKRLKVKITPYMFDAFVSLAFNAGPGNSSLRKGIDFANQKKWKEASEAIRNGPQYSGGEKLAGLTRRRNEEADWFLRPYSSWKPYAIWGGLGLVLITALYLRFRPPQWAKRIGMQ
jgi:GH24 family phage-related lysozyme (muramidase)